MKLWEENSKRGLFIEPRLPVMLVYQHYFGLKAAGLGFGYLHVRQDDQDVAGLTEPGSRAVQADHPEAPGTLDTVSFKPGAVVASSGT